MSADLGSFNLYGDKAPQFGNSTADPYCTLPEWLVFPMRGSTDFSHAQHCPRGEDRPNQVFSVSVDPPPERADFRDYVIVIDKYLVPFFGDIFVTSIDYEMLQKFARWREAKMDA